MTSKQRRRRPKRKGRRYNSVFITPLQKGQGRPHFRQADLQRLHRLRQEHPHFEIAGSFQFDASGHLESMTMNRGQVTSVEIEKNCQFCYHTHHDHPKYPSPPSATDLIYAYGDGQIHILLSEEGIYVFKRAARRKLGETLTRRKHSLHQLRAHPITQHMAQIVMDAVDKIRPQQRRAISNTVAAQKRRMNTLLNNYYACAMEHIGIHVRYYPWHAKRVPLVL